VSFKASRVWPGARSGFFQVDGLRHIIEPSANYTWVPQPNVRPWQVPQFDYQLPTTQLLPIQFPDYNSVDSIDSQNVIRWGLRNKLQTKRKGGIDNVLNWALYTDWRLTPEAGQTTFSPIYSQMDAKPFSWLTLNSFVRLDPENVQFDETLYNATLAPREDWSIGGGYHYLRQYPNPYPAYPPGPGYDIVYGTVYYRLDHNWATRVYWLHQVSQGTYDEGQFTLYRDFRSWTGALTLRIRDNPTGPNDYGVAFTFSLKANPRYKLGEDASKPTMLLGS
jgi:LPS-assembly protein